MTRAHHTRYVSLPRTPHPQENVPCQQCCARGLAVALVGARALHDLEDHLRVAIDAPPSPVSRRSRREGLHTKRASALACLRVCTHAPARPLEPLRDKTNDRRSKTCGFGDEVVDTEFLGRCVCVSVCVCVCVCVFSNPGDFAPQANEKTANTVEKSTVLSYMRRLVVWTESANYTTT